MSLILAFSQSPDQSQRRRDAHFFLVSPKALSAIKLLKVHFHPHRCPISASFCPHDVGSARSDWPERVLKDGRQSDFERNVRGQSWMSWRAALLMAPGLQCLSYLRTFVAINRRGRL